MSGRYSAARQNLTLLQDVMKKDPESYTQEFDEQYLHYQQTLQLFHLNPQNLDFDHLLELINFIAQVGHHFPEKCKGFAPELLEILRTQGPNLESDLRLSFVKAVILLRNRRQVSALEFNQLVFDYLLKCRDKALRKFLFSSIVAHIKQINTIPGKKDHKTNGQIQNLVFSKLHDSSSIVVRTALLVAIQAYRKNLWCDTKTANVIANACFHPVTKIRVTALKFMLGTKRDNEGGDSDSEMEDQTDSDNDDGQESNKTMKEILTGYKVGKKTKKRTKAMKRAKDTLTKVHKKSGKKRIMTTAASRCSIALIQEIYDPHDFAEKLYKGLEKGKANDRFEVKLLLIALVSKVIGLHQLIILSFYSFLHKYLQPHQREVTKILLYGAQATHEMIPPEIVEQMVKVIADNFVSDRNSPECMTVGLNAIREILSHSPLAIDQDLLHDLTEYKKYRNKNVSVAARSLITFYREINPKLLHRKDRGKPTESTKEMLEDDEVLGDALAYGDTRVVNYVPGSEVLAAAQSTDNRTSGKKVSKTKDEDEEDEREEEEEEDDDGEEEEDEMSDEGEGDELDSDEEEGSENDDGEEEEKTAPSTSSSGGPTEKSILSKTTTKSPKAEKMTKEESKQERVAKAAEVSETRILTENDFREINMHQLRKKIQPARGRKRKANDADQSDEEDEEDEIELDDEDLDEAAEAAHKLSLPKLAAIEHLTKRPKTDKIGRMESVMEGREGREQFGGRKKQAAHAGKTNKTARKQKAFTMLRQKSKGKKKRSFRQQQQTLKNYLTKQKKMK